MPSASFVLTEPRAKSSLMRLEQKVREIYYHEGDLYLSEPLTAYVTATSEQELFLCAAYESAKGIYVGDRIYYPLQWLEENFEDSSNMSAIADCLRTLGLREDLVCFCAI
jgi:hypothetical protein